MNNLELSLRDAQKEVDKTIKSLLPSGKGIEKKLFEAINYSILSSGKRLRPFLIIQSLIPLDPMGCWHHSLTTWMIMRG